MRRCRRLNRKRPLRQKPATLPSVNLFDFLLMAQSSQRKEPPQNPEMAVHSYFFCVFASVASRSNRSCLISFS
jgi:hypothetical protein